MKKMKKYQKTFELAQEHLETIIFYYNYYKIIITNLG